MTTFLAKDRNDANLAGMSVAEPLLIPHADADGSLCGYLRVCERDFALRIVPACPPTPARLDGCHALRSTLTGHEAALQQWLRSCTSPDEFLVELRDLLERLLRAQPAPAPLTTSSFYEQLMTEIDGVGWSALRNISPSFDRLELELLDEAQRAHVLHLSLPSDYPASPPRAEAALPAPFELQWAAEQQRFSVRGAMLQFEAALGRHQLLWDMLDDLDAHTWVLEPQHPTRDCVVRRLAIGQHCSLQLGHNARVERSARLGSAAAHCPGLVRPNLRGSWLRCALGTRRSALLRAQWQAVRPGRSVSWQKALILRRSSTQATRGRAGVAARPAVPRRREVARRLPQRAQRTPRAVAARAQRTAQPGGRARRQVPLAPGGTHCTYLL